MTAPRHVDRRSGRWWLSCLFCLAGWITGCSSPRLQESVFGPGYEPRNYVRLADRLPTDLRRVAVLPLAIPIKNPAFEHGREALDPVLRAELKKIGRFGCNWVSEPELQRWTGQSRWRVDDQLPAQFFEILRRETGCDGVLFSELREYRPYSPLAIGWRFRLVDKEGQVTLWAADEVFDAGYGPVANSARRYQIAQEELPPGLQDSRTILNSPRRFGQYTAAALLATLPSR